jgi:low affinity Fe/Cu permease
MLQRWFSRFADWCVRVLGHPLAFVIAVTGTILWFASGPVFAWSNTWQLVINTLTTVVTFLMIFVLQHSQNSDTRALHLKLDELIRSHEEANDELAEIEKDTTRLDEI